MLPPQLGSYKKFNYEFLVFSLPQFVYSLSTVRDSDSQLQIGEDRF